MQNLSRKAISKNKVIHLKNRGNAKLIIELVEYNVFANILIFREYTLLQENGENSLELYKNNYAKHYTDAELNKLFEYSKVDFSNKDLKYIESLKETLDFLSLFIHQIDPPYNMVANSFEKYTN